MGGIGEKSGLISFDPVTQPSQGERRRDEQQADDPVKPDDDQRRESERNGDHMQGAIYGVVMRTVVVRVETHNAFARFGSRPRDVLYLALSDAC